MDKKYIVVELFEETYSGRGTDFAYVEVPEKTDLSELIKKLDAQNLQEHEPEFMFCGSKYRPKGPFLRKGPLKSTTYMVWGRNGDTRLEEICSRITKDYKESYKKE